MISIGIRDLKNNLSRYIRRVASGERIAVTDHGRIVAELIRPIVASDGSGRSSRYEELLAAGIVRPPVEEGDPLADWPSIRLPRGTAARLIDEDRGDR
jgi:antitoxin (DNA-binding transcriptional repressor) of toxin-antitoxin stability system